MRMRELEKASGVGRETIRYYIREGLLPEPSRASRNSAFYSDDHVARLKAIKRLQGKVRYQPIGFELLPPKFSLTQLQRMYEIILERELDKRNFRKKVLSLGILQDLDEVEQDVAHRAARLYRFDERTYRQKVKDGFNFEL